MKSKSPLTNKSRKKPLKSADEQVLERLRYNSPTQLTDKYITLSDELVGKIINDISINGLSIESALRANGIPKHIEQQWKGLQEVHGTGTKHQKNFNVYKAFFEACKVARHRYKAMLISKVKNDPHWKAAAWLLETQFRKEFGKNIVVTAKSAINMTDEELDLAIKQLNGQSINAKE